MEIRIIESITKYSKLNRILESVNMSLFEMLELAEPIEKAIKDSGLTVPSEFKSVNKIDLIGDDHNNLMVRLDDKTEMKIGKLLTKFFPELKPNEITKIVSRVKLNLLGLDADDEYEFKLYKDNIGDWYSKCSAMSCMTRYNTSHLPYTYDKMNTNGEHHVSILILYKNGSVYGRALVWNDVEGANNGMFMDRVYPKDDTAIHQMFHQYAKSKGWAYRENGTERGHEQIYNGDDYLEIDLSGVWENIEIMPYMDTFFYGTDSGILRNYDGNYSSLVFQEVDGVSLVSEEENFENKILRLIFEGKIDSDIETEGYVFNHIYYNTPEILRGYIRQASVDKNTITFPIEILYFIYFDGNINFLDFFKKRMHIENNNTTIHSEIYHDFFLIVLGIIQRFNKELPPLYSSKRDIERKYPKLYIIIEKIIKLVSKEYIENISDDSDRLFDILFDVDNNKRDGIIITGDTISIDIIKNKNIQDFLIDNEELDTYNIYNIMSKHVDLSTASERFLSIIMSERYVPIDSIKENIKKYYDEIIQSLT